MVIGKWRIQHHSTVPVSNRNTGANRGVGFELVARFLAMGYSVYGTYRPDTRDDRSIQQVESMRVKDLHELIFQCKAQRYWREDLRA
jgi:NAD(P)-dependent dehydrogenase (short-subunit alcohol dehydrogenase family)